MRVALCFTVLNEGASIDRLLDSIQRQTRLPDEIIVVDGGSSDETVSRLEASSLPVTIIRQPGANISEGRNRAIAEATAEIIAVTDAGVVLEPEWIERLAAPIERDEADVAAGFFVADPQNDFETAMGATVLPNVDEIGEGFLPSSRSIAFRRYVWEQVGGYPEWIDYCEDLLFDFAYRELDFRQALVRNAIVHFRPRSSVSSYALQYYRYARGDGKADLWRKRQAARYITYGALLPFGLWLARRSWVGSILLVVGGLIYLKTPLIRMIKASEGWSVERRTKAIVLVPVLRVVGDLAKMAGYPVGVVWRLRNRLPAYNRRRD